MAESRFRDQEHLLRLAALSLAALIGFVALRALLVPDDFGVHGHYRARALEQNRAVAPAFSGQDACLSCHEDERKDGRHAGIRCEACHGPQAVHAHAEDPAAAKPDRPAAALCLRCHRTDVSKPKTFPQIDVKDHAPPDTCLNCHLPHRPAEIKEATS